MNLKREIEIELRFGKAVDLDLRLPRKSMNTKTNEQKILFCSSPLSKHPICPCQL